MTYEEYNNLEHAIPYMFSIKGVEGALYYFGERHSFDPADAQWEQERMFWQEFLQETRGKKRVVFVEGGIRPVADNEVNAVAKHGGMGLITYWANKEGIETYCPEPTREFERSRLLERFSQEEIEYCYFSRTVAQWHRMQDQKTDFETYVARFGFSLERMISIHESLFGTAFDYHDTQFFKDISNPTRTGTAINAVARMSSEIRDAHIVAEIVKYRNGGFSVYVQFGCTHAVMQEPFLLRVFS